MVDLQGRQVLLSNTPNSLPPALQHTQPFLKGVYSKRKEFAPYTKKQIFSF